MSTPDFFLAALEIEKPDSGFDWRKKLIFALSYPVSHSEHGVGRGLIEKPTKISIRNLGLRVRKRFAFSN
jgi:hypothetical protein